MAASADRTTVNPADRMLIADFAGAARSVPGGLYRVEGGSPLHVQDRIVRDVAGSPAVWRIEVTADAPTGRAGGIIPLFAERADGQVPKLLDARAYAHVCVRLRGALGTRTLRVEAVPGPVTVAERWGAVLGKITDAQVSPEQWRTVAVALAADGLDVSKLGAVRLMLEGEGPAWIEVDAVWLSSEADAATPPKRPAPPAHALRRAMWMWFTTEIIPDAERVKKLIAFCQAHGITDLYSQVPYEYADGKVTLRLVAEQRAFNAAARRAGVTVHALDGKPVYVFAEHHPRMYALVAALEAFNRGGREEERYTAIHLDNEPYVLPEWRDDQKRAAVLADYVALNRGLRERTKAAGLQFGVDIPFWWDVVGEDGEAKFQVETAAGRRPLLEALFPLVDNVGIMSYRQRALGPNGVVGVCETEFELGARHGVAVFASVELGTGDDVEPGISFGVFPLDYFKSQLATLQAVLARTRGCAGIAIHYYSQYERLEDAS